MLKIEDIVILDKDYNDDITIEKGRKVTLDLNGYTLNSNIKVWGELTIIDSKGTGKVVLLISLEVGYYKKEVASTPIKKVGKFTLERNMVFMLYLVTYSSSIAKYLTKEYVEEPKTDVVVNDSVIENPKLSDSIMPYVVISLISLTGIYFAVNTLRKRAKKEN